MPSPFPGMDPYLERKELWSGVHQGLIPEIRNELNTALPPGYVADIGERVFVLEPRRDFYPDVVIFDQTPPQPAREIAGGAGTAVADPPVVVLAEPVEYREVFIEIRPVAEENRVVTVMELLSYSNKTPGHATRATYLNKQREVIHSSTHLIEIDLLRSGEHTVAAPLELLRLPGESWQYIVCLHRAGDGGRFETWPRTLRQRLPIIRVPLDVGIPDIAIDLQVIFNRNYDNGAYARRIHYDRPADPPLSAEDAAWADALLQASGHRSTPT